MQFKLNGVASLTQLGVIRVQGEDAAKFLQGQLTQDFSLLGLSQARLAAFCSAKGRMQASFIGFKRNANEILLVCGRDILPATLKRLSMFVLRAKVTLTDASADYALRGVIGQPLEDLLDPVAGAGGAAWSKLDLAQASLVTLYPANGQPRALWLAPVSDPAPAGTPLSEQDWQWSEVRSGIAQISVPIVEAFVPQMLNYESVGGVNFKKGCYPGQEVVARSQFRGTLKRRAYLAHADRAMTVGEEVFQSDDDSQPCGLVAATAAVPEAAGGGFDAIVSMQISALEAASLRLGSALGAVLEVTPTPYELLADI
jgi:folate-binding protein YgfZ